MRIRLSAAIFVLVGLLVLGGVAITQADHLATSSSSSVSLAPSAPSSVYLPIVLKASSSSSAIVIDHTNANISLIPSSYITAAKSNLRLSYGHTSHGSQLVSGMTVFRSQSALYNFNTNGSIQANILSLADYTPSGDLGNPDRTTWASLTRTYLNGPSGTGPTRNVVVWSWCGEAETSNPADITTYLNLMSQLEHDYPSIKFVYMTGHLTGTGVNGDLYARNNQIRNYVRANNKILFDFADIESYDPAGNYYPNGSDACEWCTTWCSNPAHATECNLAATMSDCAHSHNFNCYRKAQAFWWLMARLAGWNGQ